MRSTRRGNHRPARRREVQLLRKDGTSVWMLGSANPVFDRNGDYVGSLALLGELTVQKDPERRLRSQLEDLRARPAARGPGPSGAVTPPAPYGEPFRTAVVVATYGTLLASIAILTTGAVFGALLGHQPAPPEI